MLLVRTGPSFDKSKRRPGSDECRNQEWGRVHVLLSEDTYILPFVYPSSGFSVFRVTPELKTDLFTLPSPLYLRGESWIVFLTSLFYVTHICTRPSLLLRVPMYLS